jgi:hypothetical protein
MSTVYKITARSKKNKFNDVVSINDAVQYEFDFSAWEEDNTTITSVTWTTEQGQAGISGQALASGVASALITFNEQGKALISVLADTGTEKKKVWLEVNTKDYENNSDDYGVGGMYYS